MSVTLHTGDCLDVLREMAADSVDSIVTDPPYGLSFMGKAWDGSVPSVEVWREALRVLRPGGHLLAFAGTRTQHRMAVAIEDAGFEIRDMIAWVYGSGFPKSLNVQQAINKAARGAPQGGADPSSPNHGKFKGGCSDDNPGGRGFGAGAGAFMAEKSKGRKDDDGEWQGWGTALKPALEPITVARKPLVGTVSKNVQTHGTGALNIDGCRIPHASAEDATKAFPGGRVTSHGKGSLAGPRAAQEADRTEFSTERNTDGRWPANLIHDGSDEVLACFPIDGKRATGKPKVSSGGQNRTASSSLRHGSGMNVPGKINIGVRDHGDTGSAARFFYCAKASKADRDDGLDHMDEQQFVQWQTGNGASGKPSSMSEGRDTRRKNTHPTVKPTDLMRYLVRLVTPPGGTVLDPFMGTGSTGRGAVMEGFSFLGIDMEAEYVEIARARIAAAERKVAQEAEAARLAAEEAARQPDLFPGGGT